MRTYSAARVKGNNMGGTQRIPREGTQLRAVWDRFHEKPGQVLNETFSYTNRDAISKLRDFYGLDIRCLRYRYWCLCGEWIDGKYVDYVAQRQSDAATEDLDGERRG